MYSFHIIVGELLQILIWASAVVILEIGGISPLQRRISLDSEFLAELFALGGAVDVGDHLGGRSLEICDELVPVGFDGLAVAAPARLVALFKWCKSDDKMNWREMSIMSVWCITVSLLSSSTKVLPRSEELDEHGLAIGFVVEIVGREFDGGRRRRQEDEEESWLSDHCWLII